MAARPLNVTLNEAFNGRTVYVSDRSRVQKSRNYFLEIPIGKDTFEVPVVALETAVSLVRNDAYNAEAISVWLHNKGEKAMYSTPDRNMRDILMAKREENMIYIPVTQGDETIIYYGGHGMLLSQDFKPLVMLSWIVEVREAGNIARFFYPLKPVLHMDPACFSGTDPMMKWCANKLFKTALTEKIYYNGSIFPISIRIEKIPFNIRIPDVPDVLTTNGDILQTVIRHIDELTL